MQETVNLFALEKLKIKKECMSTVVEEQRRLLVGSYDFVVCFFLIPFIFPSFKQQKFNDIYSIYIKREKKQQVKSKGCIPLRFSAQ